MIVEHAVVCRGIALTTYVLAFSLLVLLILTSVALTIYYTHEVIGIGRSLRRYQTSGRESVSQAVTDKNSLCRWFNTHEEIRNPSKINKHNTTRSCIVNSIANEHGQNNRLSVEKKGVKDKTSICLDVQNLKYGEHSTTDNFKQGQCINTIHKETLDKALKEKTLHVNDSYAIGQDSDKTVKKRSKEANGSKCDCKAETTSREMHTNNTIEVNGTRGPLSILKRTGECGHTSRSSVEMKVQFRDVRRRSSVHKTESMKSLLKADVE